MMNILRQNLSGNHRNHIMPFFWNKGVGSDALLRQLHAIYDSGIRAFTVEARPNDYYAKEPWFNDMRLLLEESKKLGMEVWVLDDRYYPTGTANLLVLEKYPHMRKHALEEQHVDVCGPLKDAAVALDIRKPEKGELVCIIAAERYPDSESQRMTGKAFDITDCYHDGLIKLNLPKGLYRIFTIYEVVVDSGWIDMLRDEATDLMLEGVYEPHYNALSEYFGNTFKGFFSDEPYITYSGKMAVGDVAEQGSQPPWNYNVREHLSRVCENWKELLPCLWYPSDSAPQFRVQYMDVVSKIYAKCFTEKLANWCHAHHVEYIGHVVEDNESHTNTIGVGHFFRGTDAQDMAGIDVVLNQIIPGMGHNTVVVPCNYKTADHVFFQYALAKLGASQAHIQPSKKGRAMCEIFGAYGWAEGLPMMKWLLDHMLVRGINEFVPHAFSPQFPDPDCPPHFFACGNNPEFKQFKLLMDYTNRICSLLSNGTHIADAAVLYHAEAEWSGGKYMPCQYPAKELCLNNIDFDFVSEDYLENCHVENGKMVLANERYAFFVVPQAEYLTAAIVKRLAYLAENSVTVIFVNAITEKTVEGIAVRELVSKEIFDRFESCSLEKLAKRIRRDVPTDLTVAGENTDWLRAFHYVRNGCHALFMTNESVCDDVTATITVKDCCMKEYIVYDAMANRAERVVSAGTVSVRLSPYNSMLVLFGCLGEIGDIPDKTACTQIPILTLDEAAAFEISVAETKDYELSTAYPDKGFHDPRTAPLHNIIDDDPRFAGFVKYKTAFQLEKGHYAVDLGTVGETASVWINGQFVGQSIIPPYRFVFDTDGQAPVELCIVTTSHLGYAMRDKFTSYLAMEPVGLLGPVKLLRITE